MIARPFTLPISGRRSSSASVAVFRLIIWPAASFPAVLLDAPVMPEPFEGDEDVADELAADPLSAGAAGADGAGGAVEVLSAAFASPSVMNGFSAAKLLVADTLHLAEVVESLVGTAGDDGLSPRTSRPLRR
jgi:hypothetical protein